MRQSLIGQGCVLLCALIVGEPARTAEAVASTPRVAGGVSEQIRSAAGASPGAPQSTELPAADRARIQDSFGKLPLAFIENQGQADERIAYYIQSPGHSLTFTHDGHALRLSRGRGEDTQAHTIKVELVDATPQRIESLQRAQGIVSYFKGPKEQWKTAIPTHSKIGYVQPWSGIDLSYDGTNGRLESIYTVAPHADPAQIKLRYSGQESLTLDDAGNLVYTTSLGEIKETAPIAWQDIDGQRLPVETRFSLLDDSTVAFQVAKYDPEHALIIDPTLVYAGYIGGSGADQAFAIAVDSAGNAYVTGLTPSTEATFPVVVGPDLTYNGGLADAFVAKVNAAGTALVYAGYIGGSGSDSGQGIAVDSAGNAYVAGYTVSTAATFPVTIGPDLTYNGGSVDAFVAKVNPAGTALLYAGYLGGSASDSGFGIAVDGAGNAYVTGGTDSSSPTSFPDGDGFGAVPGFDQTHNGSEDAFVAKVNPAGSALVYASYLGGSASDRGQGIAVDSAGNAYVAGYTDSTEATFPVTIGPDLTQNGIDNSDAFVAKVNLAGTALAYAGFIGGSGSDVGNGIAVDSGGNAYVVGRTSSTEADFPVAVGPDLTSDGSGDAFVAKVNPAGTALVYAGYIGGSGFDVGNGIAVDSAGSAYVTGYTDSTQADFPVNVGPDLTQNGLLDAFVAKVNPAGTALDYAGYIGGTGPDLGFGIAVDSAGSAYVAGRAGSDQASFPNGTGFASLPGVPGPDQTFNAGLDDAFVAKIAAGAAASFTLTVTGAGNGAGTVTATGIACTITAGVASGDCTELYAAGTPVPLTPVAAAGSTFAGWSGDPDCTDGTVTMNASTACTATFTLGPAPPTITNGPPPDGTVGVPYNFSYTSTGSPTFSVTAGGLPPGLNLSSAGVISGTPTTAGTFTGTVTATNGTAPDATQDFSIFISLRGAEEIPTLGGWGAIVLVLSLLALALRRMRSGRTTAS